MKIAKPLLAGSLFIAAVVAAVAACSSDDATSTPSDRADASAKDSSTTTNDAALTPAERGAQLASSFGCHSCHDSTAGVMAGNNAGTKANVAGTSATVYAANLTPDPETGLGTADGGWTDEQIARAVRTGVDDECSTLCSAMPHYDMSDAEMAALIAYLRSLPAVSNTVTNQGCPDVDGGAGRFVDAGDCPKP